MISDPFASIRRALGRSAPLARPPQPPGIDEPLVRLVHTDFGLSALFARMARQNQMDIEEVFVDELPAQLVAFLQAENCRRLVLPESPFLKKLGVAAALRKTGFEVREWNGMTLDDAYDMDCGITDAYAGVAETGSIVLRAMPGHGRAISLVPPIHVAILQPKDFVGDLMDLMAKLRKDGLSSGTVIISGPSKTADIEMSLVTGVHGPGMVQVFLLQ